MTSSAPAGYQRFNPRLRQVGLALDCLAPVASLLLRPRRPTGDLRAPERILVLESHLIGDTVLTEPLLRALRERFPRARLDLLANPWAKEVLGPCGLVDRFILRKIPWATYDNSIAAWRALLATVRELRRERYDVALDPRGDVRNAILLAAAGAGHRVGIGSTGGARYLTTVVPPPPEAEHLLDGKFRVLAPLGIEGPPGAPRLVPDPVALAEVSRLAADLRQQQGRPLVGLHPGASQAARRLGATRQVEILQGLDAAGLHPVLLGTPADRPSLERVVARSGAAATIVTDSLRAAIALFSVLDVVISMDSGPAHLAAGVGAALVVLVEPHKVGITTPRAARLQLLTSSPGQFPDGIAASAVVAAVVALRQPERAQACTVP